MNSITHRTGPVKAQWPPPDADANGRRAVFVAMHWRMLMAYPNTRLLRLTKFGLEPATVGQTDYVKGRREFRDGPAGFVKGVMEE